MKGDSPPFSPPRGSWRRALVLDALIGFALGVFFSVTIGEFLEEASPLRYVPRKCGNAKTVLWGSYPIGDIELYLQTAVRPRTGLDPALAGS